ncbi:uncharacterized protein LOC110980726 isoform X2 [Acanthaster planci]|uniref:Uncharacterized protein LOC110980726 isoform X2 n=1 Tax=Acanthaster planci TaxID=133434 RepID=A0A8B7YL44_ACAPL|nr:uncharacterized protein LOC110980726 isoform X2 [Acanthaster planci]
MMHRQLERMTTAYLILMLSLHVYGAFLPADERVLGKTRSDFIGVLRKHGERTTAVRLGSISALETATGEIPMHTAGDSPGTVTVEPGFIFREVTDGIETVQVVYDGNYVPKNCFVSADQPPVLELQDRVRQYAPQNLGTTARKASTAGKSGTKNPNIVTAPESLLPYLQYAHNASDYTLLVVPSTSVNLKLPSRLLRSMVSLDLIKSHCEGLLLNSSVVGNGRPRRSLLTYPKTLWCGKGTQATHFDQLGEEENTDRCCRAHDHCPHPQIAPMEKKLFLRNISPHTISDCRCDKAWRSTAGGCSFPCRYQGRDPGGCMATPSRTSLASWSPTGITTA